MLRRRLLYFAALPAAVIFFLFYEGYFALFLLVTLLTLPLLSLILTLPAIIGCSISLAPSLAHLQRGAAGTWILEVRTRWSLPLVGLRAVLMVENQLTGQQHIHRITFSHSHNCHRIELPVSTTHCGCLSCTVHKLRTCDLLGLFSLPLPTPEKCYLSIMPVPFPPGPVPQLTGGQGCDLGWKPRPGGGPGEDYEVREYRSGDPMRSVHWKLSSKLDKLVVRETLEPRRAVLLLTFDHFGTPEQMDAVLDRLCALSKLLTSRGLPHMIQWVEPMTGVKEHWPITDENALPACLAKALSQPAPPGGQSILDHPLHVPGAEGPPRHLHITPTLWQEGDIL